MRRRYALPVPCAMDDSISMGGNMARRSLTSQLYRAARVSNNVRAASRGPAAYGRRVVRRKVYGRSMGATGKLLKMFGLK